MLTLNGGSQTVLAINRAAGTVYENFNLFSGNTTNLAGAITSGGGSKTGNIETAGDTDWFKITLTAGQYAYVGSAHGPGGLRARVGRHLRTEKSLQWHIDYLTAALPVMHVITVAVTNGARLECTWVKRLLALNGASAPAPVKAVLGGWQVNTTVIRQAGAPLGFGNAIFNGNLKDIPLPKSERRAERWFNTNAGFNKVSSQQLANAMRTFPLRFNATRGPNQDKWDFAILKVFKIKEGLNMEFRAETFNALNHPNLYDPNTDPTSASWGATTAPPARRSSPTSPASPNSLKPCSTRSAPTAPTPRMSWSRC